MMIFSILVDDNLADSCTIRGLNGLDKEISYISLRHGSDAEEYELTTNFDSISTWNDKRQLQFFTIPSK